MKADFWQERWRKNEIGFHQRDINVSLRQYWPQLHVPPEGAVFVPLCGKSLDMLWLRAQGHPVLGVEFVEMAVRDFFTENRLPPKVSVQPPFERWDAVGIEILRGDFFQLTPEHLANVSGVYDRASLIALPPAMRKTYAEKCREIFPATAKTLLVTLSYPQDEMRGPPFAVTEEEVRDLYAANFEIELIASKDVLGANSGFRQRGVTQLLEQVFRLRSKPHH